jgi:hypothetical protein
MYESATTYEQKFLLFKFAYLYSDFMSSFPKVGCTIKTSRKNLNDLQTNNCFKNRVITEKLVAV